MSKPTVTDDEVVERFREYCRIRSDHPKPDNAKCIEFFRSYAAELGLPFEVVECVEGKPIGIMEWKGTDPTLPSILLNGHYDVVPSVLDCWDHDPYAAEMDEEGNIFGRGTQDMKCVTIQHLEALRRLKQTNPQGFLRTVYVTIVPDEEIGSADGMAKFVDTEKFKQMNIGVALDEGLANPGDEFTVFYGERAPWWFDIIAEGNAGHGSRFVENTAIPKLINVINKCLDFRAEQQAFLEEQEHKCGKTLGDVVSLNVTMLQAGSQHNVIPAEAKAGLDIRIPPHVELDTMKQKLDEWTAEEGVRYEFRLHTAVNIASDITPDSVWWSTFKDALAKRGAKIDPQIFPAGTDSRFLRALGIPAFGFSPMNNTPILLHDHNEFLNRKVFLDGIPLFETIISDLANIQAPTNTEQSSDNK